MQTMPLSIRTTYIRCLIIGGGEAAYRKLQGLIRYDLCPVLISPEVIPKVADEVDRLHLTWHPRTFCAGDTAGYTLVFAATSNSEVNNRIGSECLDRGILFDDTTCPEHGNCIVPASVDFGPLQLSCTTSGQVPSLAARLRKHWEATFPSDTAEQVNALGHLRRTLIQRAGTDKTLKKKLIQEELAPRIEEFIKTLTK